MDLCEDQKWKKHEVGQKEMEKFRENKKKLVFSWWVMGVRLCGLPEKKVMVRRVRTVAESSRRRPIGLKKTRSKRRLKIEQEKVEFELERRKELYFSCEERRVTELWWFFFLLLSFLTFCHLYFLLIKFFFLFVIFLGKAGRLDVLYSL